MDICAICGRAALVTRHHLVPRSQHARLKKRMRQSGLDRDLSLTVPLCAACHSTVHQTFSEKELAEAYDTLERLLSDERIDRWRDWLSGKPEGFSPKLRSWKLAPHRAKPRK